MAGEKAIDLLVVVDTTVGAHAIHKCLSSISSRRPEVFEDRVVSVEVSYGRTVGSLLRALRPKAVILSYTAQGLPPMSTGDVVVASEVLSVQKSPAVTHMASIVSNNILLQAAHEALSHASWPALVRRSQDSRPMNAKIGPTFHISSSLPKVRSLQDMNRSALAWDSSSYGGLQAALSIDIPAIAVFGILSDDIIRTSYGKLWSEEAAADAAAAVTVNLAFSLFQAGFPADQDAPRDSSLPSQSLAPIQVELHNGRIAPIQHSGSLLKTEESEFEQWRDSVSNHIGELCSGDFKSGTNHSRLRERLLALSHCLTSTAAIRSKEFRLGYEIARLEALIGSYNSAPDDLPSLSFDLLADLNLLLRKCQSGLSHLARWVEFSQEALHDPKREGSADPRVVASAIQKLADATAAQPKYFDSELPRSLRFLTEALRDPRGASKTIVYGAVKSAENLLVFLAEHALKMTTRTIEAIEGSVTKVVAGVLFTALGGIGLSLSGALPQGWAWLKPVLDAVARMVH